MKPLYKFSFEAAKRNDEINKFRESFQENIRCREFLDNQVSKRFDGFHLPHECLENTVKEFGYDRTMWVIANTILELKGDGRFHRENNDWAKKLAIPQSGRNHEFSLHSHSCIVDGLADDVRKMYAALGLFSGEHIADPGESQDYTGKLVILRDTALKEEYGTPENQLFLAESGFGCAPEKVGKKVFGRFLSDGEKGQFYRQDIIGIIADEHIPDWAREKLSELIAEREQTQDDTPKMGM